MAKKRRSFGKKLNQSNKSLFVGREAQLKLFNDNLTRGAEDEDFLNIFNVHGQGGVGKTTLLYQYQKRAKAANYLSAFIDTEDYRLYEVTATMNAIAQALSKQNAPFKRFDKRYKDYLQEKKELEADPEKPKGTLGSLIRGGIKASAKLGADFLVPGGNTFHELLPIDAAANAAGEWMEFLVKKGFNKDEIELLSNPLKVLTPLWLEDLYDAAEKRDIILFFDTYETANPALDQWLVELLLPQNDEDETIPANTVLVIGGRAPLGQRWHTLKEYTASILLEPFTEEEATAYLKKYGQLSEAAIKEIIAISNCLPVYLSLLAEGNPNSPDDISDPNEKIVARFLKHIKEPTQRELALHAALARKLNEDIVACLAPEDSDAAALFEWLKSRPFVQKRGGHWAYHPVVRTTMMRHQKEISEQKWEQIHDKLATWYEARAKRLEIGEERDQYFENEEWRLLQVEKHFHRLCSNYQKFIPDVIRDFVTTLRVIPFEDAIPLSLTVLKIEEFFNKNHWSRLIEQGLVACIAVEPDEATLQTLEKSKYAILGLFRQINQLNFIQDIDDRNFCYRMQGLGEDTEKQQIDAYERAIEIKKDDYKSWCNIGVVFTNLEQYEKAMQAYEKALEIKANDYRIQSNMGDALRKLKQYEQAIDAYERAIEIKKDFCNAWYGMGLSLSELERYEEEAEAYKKVVEIKVDYQEAWCDLGSAYAALKRYEDSIEAYKEAIKIKADFHHAWSGLGVTHYNLKQYEEAIKCYEKVVEIKADDYYTWHIIGWNYLLLNNAKQAERHLQKAWELSEQKLSTAPMNLGHVALLQGNFGKAMEWYKTSIVLWEDKASFLKAMQQDYLDLKMEERGISKVTYTAIVEELRQFSEA